MTPVGDVLKQAQDLVDQYLELNEEKKALDEKIASLKEKIASFSKKSNMKALKSGNYLLFVYSKLRTIFPRAGESGRKEIEEIMRKSSEWRHAITFDIVKLGQAFDKKKLSSQLIERLKSFARQEETTRVSLRDISQLKDGVWAK